MEQRMTYKTNSILSRHAAKNEVET